MNIYEVAFDMSQQNVERQQATCRSNRQLVAFDIEHVECYKLPVASTCCLLSFDMLLRHVAGVDRALDRGMHVILSKQIKS